MRLKTLHLPVDKGLGDAVIPTGVLAATSLIYALELAGTPFVPIFWYFYLPIIGWATYRYGFSAGMGIAVLCTALLTPIAVREVADSALSLETLAVLSTLALFVLAAFMTSYLLGLHHDLERKAFDLSTLLNGVAAFSSTLSVGEVLDAFNSKLMTRLDATFCCVGLLDLSDGPMVVHAAWDIDRNRGGSIESHRIIAISSAPKYQQLLASGRSLLLRGEETKDFWVSETSGETPPTMKWILLLPLVAGGRRLGVAVAGRHEPCEKDGITQTNMDLCQALAAAAATALGNAMLFEIVSEEKEKTEHVLEAMTDGVCTTDVECRLLSANSSALRTLRIDADNAMGVSLCDLFSPADDEGVPLCQEACPIRTAVKTKRSVRCGPARWAVGTGRRRTIPVVWSVAPLAGESGTVVGAVSVVRDVSREEELSRLKSEFTSMVSHELRSPLANIGAAMELMQDGNDDDSRHREMLEIVRSEVMRLGRFVEEILDAERLDSGEMPLELEPVSLLPIVRMVVETFKRQPNGHSFRLATPRRLSFVLADAAKVERVLSNLVNNAVSYSPPGSTITIEVCPREDLAMVSVVDQGDGIPPDRLDAVFERFYRAHTGDAQKVYGYGLGLYTCKMLVEAQGGQIWAESEEGNGSRLTFTLPLCEGDA